MNKWIISLASFVFVISLASSNVFAARGTGEVSSRTPLGIDVSWPQCGKSLPTSQAFGIVGVNDGWATGTNPCLKDQIIWASKSLGGTKQEKVQLYVNTANPGGLNTASWPKFSSPENPIGLCDGSDSIACAWQYGWNRAWEDVNSRFTPAINQTTLLKDPAKYIWWLDVETENTWKLSGSEFDTASNVAVLEGMTRYFKTLSIRVGLYSTGYQWGQIVGNSVSTASELNGLINWRPGGANLSTSKQACSAAPLTTGGKIVLTQFISKGLDYNYTCI